MYAQDGEKQEDSLLRILALAEADVVKGTHPQLKGSLDKVNKTISTIIEQISGIVAGQDNTIADLKLKLISAIEAKQTALEKAGSLMEAAREKVIKPPRPSIRLKKIPG